MVLFQLWKHIKRGPLFFRDTQAVGYTLSLMIIAGTVHQFCRYENSVGTCAK